MNFNEWWDSERKEFPAKDVQKWAPLWPFVFHEFAGAQVGWQAREDSMYRSFVVGSGIEVRVDPQMPSKVELDLDSCGGSGSDEEPQRIKDVDIEERATVGETYLELREEVGKLRAGLAASQNKRAALHLAGADMYYAIRSYFSGPGAPKNITLVLERWERAVKV